MFLLSKGPGRRATQMASPAQKGAKYSHSLAKNQAMRPSKPKKPPGASGWLEKAFSTATAAALAA
jgi:hypothetical protein